MTDRIKKLQNRIIDLYCSEQKSLKFIADKIGINPKTVKSVLDKNNIETRSGGQDILGLKFNKLTVVSCIGKDKNHKYIWECECECGNKTKARANDLKRNKIKSCGCYHIETSKQNIKKAIEHNHKNGHPHFKGCGNLSSRYYSALKYNAIRRNFRFSVSKEYLWELYKKQDETCSLSGIKLKLPKEKKKEQTASLDRIDSNKGYEEGNVHWVHKDINNMKQHYDLDTFIRYCDLISLQNKKKG